MSKQSVKEMSKDSFRNELKKLIHQKCCEINHYVAGCDSPFSYFQISDVQEHLRGIDEILGIEVEHE